MLRSCRRCLIVTLFSEQYDSIDLISSKVIISVFIAKVAGQRTCYNMHFVGCLQYFFVNTKTGEKSGEMLTMVTLDEDAPVEGE